MSSLQQPIDTLKRLIAFPSVSSSSNRDISDAVSEHLESLGFDVEQSSYKDAFGATKVNLVARRDPASKSIDAPSGLAYFCHTDVVPAGEWTGPGAEPFVGVVQDDRIYGRGSCDMKGSLVAMMAAAAEVIATEQTAPLWIVCTADEEVGFEAPSIWSSTRNAIAKSCKLNRWPSLANQHICRSSMRTRESPVSRSPAAAVPRIAAPRGDQCE